MKLTLDIPEPKIEAYCLVRDRFGKPRIDGDPRKLPTQIIDMMTEQEFELAVYEWKVSKNEST